MTRLLMRRTLKKKKEEVSESAGTPRECDYEVFVSSGRQLAVAGEVKSSLLLPF